MIKKIPFLFIFLIIVQYSFGQVVTLQAGPSISNLKWSIDEIEAKGKNKTFMGKSVFLGLDYFDSRHFNLSSNVGFLQKGDISEITYTNDDEVIELPQIKAVFNYLSVNTLAEFKLPLRQRLIPYISFGPRVDYMVSHSKDFNFIKEINELPAFSYGANLGGGINVDFTRLQLGIRSDYYLNFAKMADWVSGGDRKGWIYDQTFLINLTVGYKLR